MLIVGIAKAFDGHSLVVDGNPIRLNGIDAPGLKQLCMTTGGLGWRCGEKALETLSSVVTGRKTVCVVDAPAGHGAAATCSVQQVRDIGKFIVESGFAVPNKSAAGKYTQSARQAAAYRKGIWSGQFNDPAKWRSANP
jgi:endonuclease YncB( thermonuclease family)